MEVFWTMKNGSQINVDKMEISHLRNVLKMIIRNSVKVIPKNNLTSLKRKEIGNIENNFLEQMILEDYTSEDEYDFLT